MVDPRQLSCGKCGAFPGESCINANGSELAAYHSERGGHEVQARDWQEKYDLMYRQKPEGGWFGPVWRRAA